MIDSNDEKIYVAKNKSPLLIGKGDGEKINREPFTAETDPGDLEKGTYEHYMLKEIDEKLKADLLEAKRLYIVACGTSYHTGLVGTKLIEKLTKLPTEVHVASEFTQDPQRLKKILSLCSYHRVVKPLIAEKPYNLLRNKVLEH